MKDSPSTLPAQPDLAAFPPADRAAWDRAAEASLKGRPLAKLISETVDGIKIPPIFLRGESRGLPAAAEDPGLWPYVRGTRGGAAAHGWEVAQEVAFGDPKTYNQTVHADLARGGSVVVLSLDQAGRHGRDPDHAQAGEVGVCGVSIASVEDLRTAFAGVPLEKLPLQVQAGPAILPFTTLLAAFAAKSGLPLASLRGGLNADPLGEWLIDGSLAADLTTVLHGLASLVSWTRSHAPGLRAVAVRPQLVHDAGGTPVQEMAHALACGTEYLRELTARGVSVEDAALSIRFVFSCGTDFFGEIAKLRAVRACWARVVTAAGGSPAAAAMVQHVRTSLWAQSRVDPHNNILRATIAAFAAGLAGCASQHVAPFDEVVRRSSPAARRLALNTQTILLEECHALRVADPAGGAWAVEDLTREMAEKAWSAFQNIEASGGLGAMIRTGAWQKEIETAAVRRLGSVARRRQTVTGVNKYADPTEQPLPSGGDEEAAALLRRRAAELGGARVEAESDDATGIIGALADVTEKPPQEVLPALIHAARLGATLGELTRALHGARHRSDPIVRLPVRRAGEQFEGLREAVWSTVARGQRRPSVFLLNMGPLRQHKARADFARGFLEPGGFEVVYPAGFETVPAAVEAAMNSGAAAAVLCSTDETYPELVPAILAEFTARGAKLPVLLAGYPEESVERFRQLGVADFIHLRADCHAVLEKLQNETGIES